MTAFTVHMYMNPAVDQLLQSILAWRLSRRHPFVYRQLLSPTLRLGPQKAACVNRDTNAAQITNRLKASHDLQLPGVFLRASLHTQSASER